MKVVQGHEDFIKTIKDGEEVENFSEESDEEIEVYCFLIRYNRVRTRI